MIRYAEDSGYDLEGPSYYDIMSRNGWNIVEIYNRCAIALSGRFQTAHGWETARAEALTALADL